jgi:hypothetical protein
VGLLDQKLNGGLLTQNCSTSQPLWDRLPDVACSNIYIGFGFIYFREFYVSWNLVTLSQGWFKVFAACVAAWGMGIQRPPPSKKLVYIRGLSQK